MPQRASLLAGNLAPVEGAGYALSKVAGSLSFLADLIPADIQLLQVLNSREGEGPAEVVGGSEDRTSDERVPSSDVRRPTSDVPPLAVEVRVLAEAAPSVRPSFYRRSHLGFSFPMADRPSLGEAYRTQSPAVGINGEVVNGMPLHQTAYPVRDEWGRIGGVLLVERNLREEWRQGPKLDLYRSIIHELTEVVLAETGMDVVPLPPLLPGDALVILDPNRRVVHASYTAMNLARFLGITEPLEGNLFDDVFVGESWKEVQKTPLFSEREMMRKRITISLREIPTRSLTLLVLHDITELKHKERELQVKSAILQEVHHRVKNNLQTIASLLRLQQRRSQSPEVRTILDDSIKRISSIALVHEYLMHEDMGQVDLQGLVNDLMSATLQGVVDLDKEIVAQVICPDPAVMASAQATSIALVLTELIQNSVKHAFPGQSSGLLTVEMESRPAEVAIAVTDNGIGLPPDFDPETHGNLGWRIIGTLVHEDLDGRFIIDRTVEKGTRIVITLPKNK